MAFAAMDILKMRGDKMSDYIEREKLIKALEQLGTPEILAAPEADRLYRDHVKYIV